MDEEILDLVDQLCTRAGMIMEDASVDVLLLKERSPQASAEKIARLGIAAQAISALVAAASALHRAT